MESTSASQPSSPITQSEKSIAVVIKSKKFFTADLTKKALILRNVLITDFEAAPIDYLTNVLDSANVTCSLDPVHFKALEGSSVVRLDLPILSYFISSYDS